VTPPPLLRLCRPVLAPTAAADVLAGAALSGGLAARPGAALLAAAGSVALYAAGMAQNDVWDRGVDREKAPDRPLVRDPALLRHAVVLVAALYAGGVAAAGLAGALLPALLVALLANAYNLGLKRAFPADAAAMGGARVGNLWIGLAVGGAGLGLGTAMLSIGYGLYIAAVTAASRAEDLAPAPTRALAVLLSFLPATIAYALLIGFVAGPRGWVALAPWALHAGFAFVAVRSATKEAAKRYVFRSLLLILAFHAVWLWGAGARDGIIAVLGCAAATFLLRAAFTSRPGSPAAPSGPSPSDAPGTSS